LSVALTYHERTKHHFNRFARSLGHLDWATQPDPFRRYAGAPLVELPRRSLAADAPYDALFEHGRIAAAKITRESIGEFLRCSMGLSAWKQFGASRWALRVNPSSGNLHPTETYVVHRGRVCHYAVREHALQERCVFQDPRDQADDVFAVGLTSIYWREAWKYGERAFRYCQHDAGHAIGALRFAAALLGWRLALLPRWSDAQVSRLLGLDREADYGSAEREEPECLAVVTPGDPARWLDEDPALMTAAAAAGTWAGVANRLSPSTVSWPIIDEVSAATRYPGGEGAEVRGAEVRRAAVTSAGTSAPPHDRTSAQSSARSVIVARRSALAFDARSGLRRDAFLAMLRRLRPGSPPWDAIDWPPHVHLVLFVHRVEGLVPGIYAYLRDASVLAEWRAAMRRDFLWERMHAPNESNDSNESNDPNDPNDLFLLVPIDCRRLANRVSCDQEIAEDGFFSLAMLARLEGPLGQRGEWFYRRLFWECGLIGQVLYLEAEAVGARSTGIGCFYDDPVHEMLGLTGHAWQSLYHFSMGMPVEDTRLTSAPGYDWDQEKGI
jgi:SagB-type dehydrogenase family enzyme